MGEGEVSSAGAGSAGVNANVSPFGDASVSVGGGITTDGKVEGSGQKAKTGQVFKDELESNTNVAETKKQVDPRNPILSLPKVMSLDPNLQSWFSGASIACQVVVMAAMIDLISSLRELKKVETKFETEFDLAARAQSKLAYELTQKGVDDMLAKQMAATIVTCTMAAVSMGVAAHGLCSYARTSSKADKAALDADAAAQKPQPLPAYKPVNKSDLDADATMSAAEKQHVPVQKQHDDLGQGGKPLTPEESKANMAENTKISAQRQEIKNKNDDIEARNMERKRNEINAIWSKESVKNNVVTTAHDAGKGAAQGLSGMLATEGQADNTMGQAGAGVASETGKADSTASQNAAESKKSSQDEVYHMFDSMKSSLKESKDSTSKAGTGI